MGTFEQRTKRCFDLTERRNKAPWPAPEPGTVVRNVPPPSLMRRRTIDRYLAENVGVPQ